ncbi:MAG: helix-turn-helix transcriptional regulator [Candidatus Saccharimonadales bacterium]
MQAGDKVINHVARYRRQVGVTQEELATAVNVTRQTIISIEKGNYVPSVLLALKLARYFKLPMEKVFSL